VLDGGLQIHHADLKELYKGSTKLSICIGVELVKLTAKFLAYMR
jgi:hypothetical protein